MLFEGEFVEYFNEEHLQDMERQVQKRKTTPKYTISEYEDTLHKYLKILRILFKKKPDLIKKSVSKEMQAALFSSMVPRGNKSWN